MTGDGYGGLPVFDAPPDGKMTDDMVQAYADYGVVILENFTNVDACARLRDRANDLIGQFDSAEVRSVFSTVEHTQLDDRYFIESGDKIRFFLEADAFDERGELRQSKEHSLNKMGHAMHDLDPVFDDFSRSPALNNIVRRIGVKEPGIIQSMYIFKPPRIGGEVVFHQDSTYIYTEPESCVGFWFALEDATLENGCMHFIPGGHKGPLRARNRRIGGFSLATEVLDPAPWDESNALPAEASAGTLVVFDGRAPHMSLPNTSDRSRHAYTLHVIDKACDYPASNRLQRSADLPLRGFI